MQATEAQETEYDNIYTSETKGQRVLWQLPHLVSCGNQIAASDSVASPSGTSSMAGGWRILRRVSPDRSGWQRRVKKEGGPMP